MKQKNKNKNRFLRIFIGTLGASLLVNLLTGEGVMRAGAGTIRAN